MVFQSMVSLMMAIAIFFMYCYLGDEITSKSLQIADDIYGRIWYEYPVDSQKYMILMIMRAQRPFYFTGLTNSILNCSLETFKAVSNYHDHQLSLL